MLKGKRKLVKAKRLNFSSDKGLEAEEGISVKLQIYFSQVSFRRCIMMGLADKYLLICLAKCLPRSLLLCLVELLDKCLLPSCYILLYKFTFQTVQFL